MSQPPGPPPPPQGQYGPQGGQPAYGYSAQPYAQQAIPPKKGKGCLIAALVVVGIVALIGIVAVVLLAGAAKDVAEGLPSAASTSAGKGASQAPTDPADPDPAGGKAKIGEPFPFEGRKGTGSITVVSAKWVKKGLVEPDSGNYLILDIKVTGNKGEISYNPFYFKVKDSDGREYNLALGADAEPSLKSGSLEKGDKARGYLAFDMKKGDVKLTVTDELLQDAASINIPG